MSLAKQIICKLFNLPYDESCSACKVLQAQLDHTLIREKELLDRLLQLTEPEVIPTQPIRVEQPLVKAKSFRAAAAERELQDKIAASKIKKISDLERELKIPATEAEANAELEDIEKSS